MSSTCENELLRLCKFLVVGNEMTTVRTEHVLYVHISTPCSPLKVRRLDSILFLHDHDIKIRKSYGIKYSITRYYHLYQ